MYFLKLVWKKWLKIARIIGNFQSQVILSVFYLTVILPLGVVFRTFADPLALKIPVKRTAFSKWQHPKENLEQARKQF